MQRMFVCVVLAVCGLIAAAQQPAPPSQPANSGAAAHYDRMAAAKTVFLKNVGGNDIPFNVISRNFESWGRYILVDSAEQADMVIEILSPGDDRDKKDTKDAPKTSIYGGPQNPPATARPTTDVIVFTVYDKNKKPMWIAREEPKFALKHKTEETHLMEAAQKLFTRFHDRIEPPAKP